MVGKNKRIYFITTEFTEEVTERTTMSTATSDEDSDYDFGWPWMKGAVDVTKTGVIAESSEESDDPRPLVKDLIDQYQEHNYVTVL